MYEKAKELGCDYIATGHYAKIAYDEKYKKNVLKILVSSSMENKIKRATEFYHMEKEKAAKEIARINKLRSNHYEYYTERGWETTSNYDICVNSYSIGINNVVDLICSIVEKSKELAIK